MSKTLMEEINAVRMRAAKEGIAHAAIGLKQVMLKVNRRQAHVLLNNQKIKKAKQAATTPRGKGRERFYTSRSGGSVKATTDLLPTAEVKKKTETVVTESKPTPLHLISKNTTAALAQMDDPQLDEVFQGNLKTEKSWLKQRGYSIHPSASRASTRKRLRAAFDELLNDEEE